MTPPTPLRSIRRPRDDPARAPARSLGRPAAAPMPRSTRAPRLIAAAVAASALITLASAAFSPAVHLQVVWRSVPFLVRAGAASAAALAGAGTLVVAGALARRQLSSWSWHTPSAVTRFV